MLIWAICLWVSFPVSHTWSLPAEFATLQPHCPRSSAPLYAQYGKTASWDACSNKIWMWYTVGLFYLFICAISLSLSLSGRLTWQSNAAMTSTEGHRISDKGVIIALFVLYCPQSQANSPVTPTLSQEQYPANTCFNYHVCVGHLCLSLLLNKLFIHSGVRKGYVSPALVLVGRLVTSIWSLFFFLCLLLSLTPSPDTKHEPNIIFKLHTWSIKVPDGFGIWHTGQYNGFQEIKIIPGK